MSVVGDWTYNPTSVKMLDNLLKQFSAFFLRLESFITPSLKMMINFTFASGRPGRVPVGSSCRLKNQFPYLGLLLPSLQGRFRIRSGNKSGFSALQIHW